MTQINNKYLELFPSWLENLGQDVSVLQECRIGNVSQEVKKILTGGINYLFKSLDIIPDGIDDIGYLDDAFVLRMSARIACDTGIDGLPEEMKASLGRIADEVTEIRQLLGEPLFRRFAKYTGALSDGSARGRTVDEIIENEETSSAFALDVADFIKNYTSPGFTKDEKNIIKLKAFMEAKLPH
jgi:uncharacterized membrane protein YkvA (DUF1232 family)